MTRYVGLRCPACGDASPTLDQEVNIRRDELTTWWVDHRLRHFPRPIIAGNIDHLNAAARSAGFYGYSHPGRRTAGGSPCNTPWACSERGACPIANRDER